MPPTNANALTPSTTTTTNNNSNNNNTPGAAVAMGPPKKDSSSSSPTQQQLRPPLYNAEDYASALRALFTNSLSLPNSNSNSSNHHHHPHHQYQHAPPPTSLILEHASTHPPLIPGQGLIDMNKHNHQHHHGSGNNKGSSAAATPEMSMKKFINGSELLFKLEADLRSAFPSFVQEFVSGDSEGVSCILDALRTVHEALDHVNGLREQRKLVLDERSCIQCLHLMMRNIDAIQKLLTYPHGLYPIVHCTVSTNTSTRVLALEILTSICEQGGSGGGSNNDAFAKVSEAISTLRLRLGEPIRCKVLVGAITSAAAGVFQATGIRFLKSYVGASPSAKFKVYLQVELEEAGFHVDVIRKSAELSPARESRLVIQELDEWDRVVVDVDTVVRQNSQLRNSVATLQQEIATLKDRIKKQEPSQSTSSTQSSSIPVYATPRQSHPKFTKKKQHANNNPQQQSQQQQQQSHQNRQLHSSTPIQTITTPVDSEEEAEQIHQILEDLHNIVNNEMLQGNGSMVSNNNNNENNNRNSSNNIAVLPSSGMSTTTTCSTTSGEIVPVLNSSRPPLMLMNHNNNRNNSGRPVHSEPNLLFMDESSSSATFYQNSEDQAGGSGGRVKDVVQQLENSNVLFNTLPNFNTGGLASKFANFKSSKLDGRSGNNGGNSGWGDTTGSSDSNNLMMMMTMMEQAQAQMQQGGGGGGRTRVKSLENLDNFTLKWKYPVVVGGGGGEASGGGKAHAMQQQQQLQQPNSLVVLQDYRMNRFGSGGGGGGGNSNNNKSSSNKEQRNSPSKESSGSSSGGGGGPAAVVAGLFSKNKKKHLVHHPQKTFQISLVGGGSSGGKQASGGGGAEGSVSKVTNSSSNMNFNDLGGGGGGGSGGSNNPSSLLLLERVTDLPSGLY